LVARAAVVGCGEAAVVVAEGGEMNRAQSFVTNAIEIAVKADRWNKATSGRAWAWLAFAFSVVMFVVTGAIAAGPAQKTFATPEDAASALVQAVKVRDQAATLAVLGNAGDWLSSGDATADRATAEKFVAEYDTKHSIVRDGDKATLTLGDDGFPFAFPLVKSGEKWHFDTLAGKDELLARRIGGNELDTIKVLQAIVDAERDYASEDRNGDGVLDYAQKFASSPGKRDGLYWPTKAGEPESPLGPLIAGAAGEGYKKSETAPMPYHGYYYRMLKGQGKNAESGAFDYVVHGRGIAGFAVVAYPAKYGNSGIMTFIVNQDGKVYQSDLGLNTRERASKMQRFDPGSGWSVVKVP
jgi:hypothetical protein